MITMTPKAEKKKFLAADPAFKGKELYILYKFDTNKEEMVSEGPFLKKNEAYDKMNTLLKEGVCSWVVLYNG